MSDDASTPSRTTLRPPPLLERVLDSALRAGAVGAEVLHVEETGCELELRGSRRGPLKPLARTRTSGRVFVQGGGCASWSVDRGDEVEAALVAAVARAREAEPDPLGGPAERYPIAERGHGIEDPRYSSLDDEERVGAVHANAESLGGDGMRLVSCVYREVRCVRSFANTNGVRLIQPETLYEQRTTVADSRGKELTKTATGRAFANVGALPYAASLGKRLLALREIRGLPPGEPALILPPRALARIVADIAPAFSAKRVAAGGSFVDKHERLGAARVHITDDGSMHGGPRSRSFDDRGVPPMPVTIVREGQLGGLFHDERSAREAGVRPTGHVVDGELRPSNLVVRKGNRSRTQMLGEVPLSIFADNLEGSVDLETGAMRYSGPGVILVSGKPRGAVAEVILEGNVVDLLGALVELASDQERTDHVDCATAVFKGFPLQVR
jgi:PmbA protein